MSDVPELHSNHGVDPITQRALRSTLVIPLLEKANDAALSTYHRAESFSADDVTSPSSRSREKPRLLGVLQFINFDSDSYIHLDIQFVKLLGERLAPIVAAAVRGPCCASAVLLPLLFLKMTKLSCRD